jgi:hypothetical protein
MRLQKLKLAALLAFASMMISLPTLAQGGDNGNRNEDRKFHSDQVTPTTDAVARNESPRKFHSDQVIDRPAGNSLEKDLQPRKFHSDEVVIDPIQDRPARQKSTELANNTAITSNAVKLYPNPATVDFTVQIDQTNLTEATVMITDMLGKVVYHEQLINPSGSLSTKVNTEGMAEGVYLVTVVTATDQQTKRLVVR